MTDDPTPGTPVQAGAALYDRRRGKTAPEPVTAERNPGALLWESLHSRDPQTRTEARAALAERRAASQQPAAPIPGTLTDA